MSTFLEVLIPLAVLCIGLGILVGGKIGHVFIIAGTVLSGVAVVLALLPE